RGIERAYQAVLHDTGHGDRTPAPTEVSLDRQGGRIGRQLRVRQRRFRRDLLIARFPPRTSLVCLRGGHQLYLSVRGDHEDWYIAQVAEDVGNLVVFPVIPPDYPDF